MASLAEKKTHNKVEFLLVGIALAIIGAIYSHGISTYLSPGSDEGIYVSQAWAVLHGSLQPYTFWYDHPPFGWIQLAALLAVPFKLFPHVQAVMLGRYVMVFYALISSVFVYVIAKRLGANKFFSLIAMLGMLSPLALLEMRQVLLDCLALPWVLAAFAMALSPRRQIWHYFASGVFFAVGVLTKETLVLLLPALFYALWITADKRLRFMSAMVQLTSMTLVVFAYPLFAVLRRELIPGEGHVSLWSAITWQLGSRAGSGAVWVTGSTKYDLVEQWVTTDKFLIGAGLIAAMIALANRKLRTISIAVLVMMVPIVKPSGYLPGMYVTAAIPFLSIAVAGVLSWAWTHEMMHVTWKLRSLMAYGVKRLSMVSVAVVVLLSGIVVAPAWASSPDLEPKVDAVAPSIGVEEYLKANVGRDKIILAEASYFVDLIDAGWKAPWQGVVWYTQLDLDTSAAQQLPLGWRSVDYVVASQQVKRDVIATPLPKLGEAINKGVVVAEFGAGEDLVQIIKVGN